MKRHIHIALLVVLALTGIAPAVRAQETHTFAIRDGKVYLDGRPLPEDRLPASLNLEGLQANLTFSGNSQAVMEINGILYLIDAGGLREVRDEEAEERGVAVFFKPSGQFEFIAPADAPFGVMHRQYVEALSSRARSLQALSNEMEQRQARELDRVLRQARDDAEAAARAADALPRIELQSYLDDVRRYDHHLFERLMREQQMEGETQRLAAEIRSLPEGRRRTTLVEQLRARLAEIFELKQENRRREIAQLEAQLQTLRERMNERERLRERIIEQRLHELLGRPSPFDW
ncbi:hypothetical protein GQ464_006150 [Rhodocaloribacter litoris]|uniref:hypothetical protein n=1 Tax=Rhodocaloribacter litoris TaxID=2558931 RepID=UPI0014200E75|nr:hypothetical protein [Rhodocaloribacter litoris]QXD16527.1 hypothetical protein GQ464_006150 [Rhodocaloribacter litoris]GIV59496.1 MAG: hypothetical protein KatS3mg043_0585 [Rhodothermaceae bacterium]